MSITHFNIHCFLIKQQKYLDGVIFYVTQNNFFLFIQAVCKLQNIFLIIMIIINIHFRFIFLAKQCCDYTAKISSSFSYETYTNLNNFK